MADTQIPWMQPGKKRAVVLAAVLLAIFLRTWAAWQLPVDADEPVYVQAGFEYARLLRAGDLQGVIDYAGNREHPPLVKLVYAGTILASGEQAGWERALLLGRLVSALAGSLAVWLAALANPVAGLLLAVQTLVVKYTGQAYLEALPLLASLAAVLALLRAQSPRDRWVWVSAAAFGLALAGKLAYFPVVIPAAYIFLREKRFSWKALPLYLLAAGLTFWALNPALWHDPLPRLLETLQFHAGYSQSAHVHQAGYPWYQPFLWVGRSMPYQWHPDVFFYLGFDGLIALLGLYGAVVSWKGGRRWPAVWMAAGMLFLLAWPVKWPQYALVVLPAFCFSAAQGLADLWRRASEWDLYWNWVDVMRPRPSKPVLLLTVFVVMALTLGDMLRILRADWYDRGWTSLSEENSPLPGGTVAAFAGLPDGRMALAGSGGLSFFELPEDTRLPAGWQSFTVRDSDLPAAPVSALAVGTGGELSLGTPAGVSRLHGQSWTHTPLGEVVDLAYARDGTLWAAGAGGLAAFDGQSWQSFTPQNSPLPAGFVLALAVEETQAGGEVVWAGTEAGLARLDTRSGAWQVYAPGSYAPGGGGIAGLLVDSRGRLWVATLGSGIAVWEGDAWMHFRAGDSGLTSNYIREIAETRPGSYWAGATRPGEVGGGLFHFDGQEWREYTPDNSGFNGGEPLAFAEDRFGRLWIGTRSDGLLIFEER